MERHQELHVIQTDLLPGQVWRGQRSLSKWGQNVFYVIRNAVIVIILKSEKMWILQMIFMWQASDTCCECVCKLTSVSVQMRRDYLNYTYHLKDYTFPLWLAMGPRSLRGIIYKTAPLKLHSFCRKWKGLDPIKRFNHSSLVALATQLTVLSWSAVNVKSKFLLAFLWCHFAF